MRLEIETLALDVFTQGTADIDIPAIVTRSWADLNMDAVVDEAVAAAVLEARQNSDYWSRFLSGWSVAGQCLCHGYCGIGLCRAGLCRRLGDAGGGDGD